MKNVFAILGILIIGILLVGCTAAEKAQTSDKSQGQLVGNDRDAHGCIGSAGYSWCEAKQTCLRPWEEKCVASTQPAENASINADVSSAINDMDAASKTLDEVGSTSSELNSTGYSMDNVSVE